MSIVRVAQGYVIAWNFTPEASRALASVAADEAMASADSSQQQLTRPLLSAAESAAVHFAIELCEQNATTWTSVGLTRDLSHLLRDIRAGTHKFRVVAYAESGVRGAASAELSYTIPGELLRHLVGPQAAIRVTQLTNKRSTHYIRLQT